MENENKIPDAPVENKEEQQQTPPPIQPAVEEENTNGDSQLNEQSELLNHSDPVGTTASIAPPQLVDYPTALKAVKDGHAAQREGWNGKGMFVWLNKGSRPLIPNEDTPSHIEGIPSGLFILGNQGTIVRMPNVNIRTASGSNSTWVPSATDQLAEDWIIITG